MSYPNPYQHSPPFRPPHPFHHPVPAKTKVAQTSSVLCVRSSSVTGTLINPNTEPDQAWWVSWAGPIWPVATGQSLSSGYSNRNRRLEAVSKGCSREGTAEASSQRPTIRAPRPRPQISWTSLTPSLHSLPYQSQEARLTVSCHS